MSSSSSCYLQILNTNVLIVQLLSAHSLQKVHRFYVYIRYLENGSFFEWRFITVVIIAMITIIIIK